MNPLAAVSDPLSPELKPHKELCCMKTSIAVFRPRLIGLALITLGAVIPAAHAARLAPDGTYVEGEPRLAPDGTYVGGEPRLAPDGTYVSGEPRLAPDGTYVGGEPHLAPDGSYVGGAPRLAPDGRYVGSGEDDEP